MDEFLELVRQGKVAGSALYRAFWTGDRWDTVNNLPAFHGHNPIAWPLGEKLEAIERSRREIEAKEMRARELQFFPPEVPIQWSNPFYSAAMYLSGEGEKPLLGDPTREAYRLTMLGEVVSFSPPEWVRIEHRANEGTCLWTNHLKVGKQLTVRQWQDFVERINTSKFWDMARDSPHGGLDGECWLLEGSTPNRYKVVERWTPADFSDQAAFVALCSHLIKMGKAPE
ncbi:MAG TPA: hypothetical protein VFI76_00955 [Terrimicrobiaceae bacterium]|nr:hypothetical protein [Terrimicrobiaceae bacterium]